MAEQVRPPEDKEKERKEKERQAKLKRLAEVKKKLAELEKIDKVVQKSATEAAASAGSETAEATADSETTEATKEKLGEVDDLTSQLGDIEAMLDKEAGVTPEGVSEIPTKTLEQIETELARLETEVAKEAQEKVLTAYEKLKEIYPWMTETRSEFMYAIPPDPKSKDFASWQEDWSRVLFDYARLAVLHVLYMKKLLGEPPFSNFRDRDKAVELIANYLVGKKLARWITKSREEIRILWKSLEEMAGEVEKWATENVGSEPVILQELKDAGQIFSTLPDEEWEEIFKILKKQKKITMIKLDSGQEAIKFYI